MMVDNNLILSGAVSSTGTVSYQTVTGTGNVLSTNTIDLASGGIPTSGQVRDIGEGRDVYVRWLVGTAQAGATSVEVQAIYADDAGLTTNVTVVGSSGAIAIASLTAGTRGVVEINPRVASRGQRYFGVRYVIVGTSSAGTFFTDLGDQVTDGQKFYAVGYAVS